MQDVGAGQQGNVQAALVDGGMLIRGDLRLPADVEQRADEAPLGKLHGGELQALRGRGLAVGTGCSGGRCGAGGVVLHKLAEFFLERHLLEQIVDAALDPR